MPVYNKLVRDRIPKIIAAAGHTYEIAALSDEEYPQALFTKLVEEAQEAASADLSDLTNLSTEIANLYEVLDALIAHYELDRDAILELQRQRREDRGGFQDRTFLLSTN